jgi:hypothetical protein
MSKIGIECLGEHLLSGVAGAIKGTDRAVQVALERQHLSHWHPASTAPYNKDLELNVSEDGITTTLPFPCLHTNGDDWINVDLGTPLRISPVEWRPWQQLKSPHPYQTSIFVKERSASHRQEQWGGCHGATSANRNQSSS